RSASFGHAGAQRPLAPNVCAISQPSLAAAATVLLCAAAARFRPAYPWGAGPVVRSRADPGHLVTGLMALPPRVPRPIMDVAGPPSRRGDRDDVLVWGALAVLAGRPGLGRDAAVLGPGDLGHLRPGHRGHTQASQPRQPRRRRAADPGPAAGPR